MAPVEKSVRWTYLDNHITYEKFFTRAISFKPETCESFRVEILKLGLVKILNFKFCGDADVWLRFFVDAYSRFWRWNVIKIYVWTSDMTSRSYFVKMNSILGSVVPLAMFFWLPVHNQKSFLVLFQRGQKTELSKDIYALKHWFIFANTFRNQQLPDNRNHYHCHVYKHKTLEHKNAKTNFGHFCEFRK